MKDGKIMFCNTHSRPTRPRRLIFSIASYNNIICSFLTAARFAAQNVFKKSD